MQSINYHRAESRKLQRRRLPEETGFKYPIGGVSR